MISLFITNKTFKVNINLNLSPLKTIEAGVPQVPLLRPTLFNISVSDIPKITAVSITVFADNIAIITPEEDTNIKKV